MLDVKEIKTAEKERVIHIDVTLIASDTLVDKINKAVNILFELFLPVISSEFL